MDLASLSLQEQAALLKTLQGNLNAAKDARLEEYATLGAEFFAHVVDTAPFVESEYTDWAGFSEYGIPLKINGRDYTASLRITDTARKAERVEGVDFHPKKKTAAAAKKDAEVPAETAAKES